MRFRIEWTGLFDGPRKYKRILTLEAASKEQAGQLHDRLYPIRTRKIVRERRRK